MIYFICGFILGCLLSMSLYSIVVSDRISSLETENAHLIDDLQHERYDNYKRKYLYEDFEETK